MKTVWSAKVHKSGSKIQLLKNGSVTKIISSDEGEFAPAEAQKFATNLVGKLNDKAAKQMTDPGAQPSVATEGETHSESLKAVAQDAKGVSVKEASALKKENVTLKKRIARIEKEANIERKARRGLAIAKMMVDQKKIANDEATVKSEVMKIVAMSNDEISLLERQAAGLPLYETAESAKLASRRYARMSRLHRQAAEDAQLAGNEKVADDEDTRAARCEELSKQAFEASTADYSQYNTDGDAVQADDIGSQVKKDPPQGVDAAGKKSASKKKADDDDDDDDDDDIDDEDLIEEVDDDEEDFEDEDIDDEMADDDMDFEAAASIYQKIASNHKTAAAKLKKEGNEAGAATEMEIAKEAEELAASITASNEETAKEANDDSFNKEASNIYRKIAADHRKKADEHEANGDSAAADLEDEIADEAEEMAASVEAAASDDNDADDVVAEEVEIEACGDAAADAAADTAAEEVEASDDSDADDVVAEDALEDDTAAEDANEVSEDVVEDAIDLEAGTDDDPLAALLGEDEKAAEVEEEEIVDAEMPTDEEIEAALANEDYDEDSDELEVTGASEETTSKEAGSTGTKKTANEGYSSVADVDRIEQNPMANSRQAVELEDMWRKDQ